MKKYITFGEIMLRLKPPNWERFFQSPLLEATLGDSRLYGSNCHRTGTQVGNAGSE